MAEPVEPAPASMTSSSRATRLQRVGYAIAGIPFAMILVAQVLAPGFLEPIFANPPEIVGLPAGIVLLFVAAIWASLAFVVIRANPSGLGIAVGLLVFTVPAILAILYLPSTILIVLNLNY
jgi:hypothetical protein